MAHDEDNEEEREHLTPEQRAKLDDLKERTKAIMSEAVEITATEEEKEMFETKFKELFKSKGIPWMFNNLKIFNEAMEFGQHIAQGPTDMQVRTLMHLQRIIQRMDKDIKKRTPKI